MPVPSDAGGDAAPDAIAPADAVAPLPTCTQTGRLVPARTLVVNAPNETGVTCGEENVFADDGKLVGLDRSAAGDCAQIDGRRVSGCVAVEMPSKISIAYVRMLTIARGCVNSCVADACGTGQTANVFVGANLQQLKFLREQEINGASTEYAFPITSVSDARVVVVCRTCFGVARDDIGVDAIVGECR